MLSNISLARLEETHPELQRRVKNLADALAAEDIAIQIDAGLRTAQQQDNLFAVGRTMPGKIVTDARGFQSNHVIGCAVDVWVENVDTSQPDWDASHPAWQRIVALAPQYGLRDGKSWHDLPHLELVEVPTEPSEAAQQICKVDGVQAVWDSLNVPTFGS
jgi:peptidoglycan L-alanyl-D-glutamate endopeptidase CwlK